jgi:hypothetical protein
MDCTVNRDPRWNSKQSRGVIVALGVSHAATKAGAT